MKVITLRPLARVCGQCDEDVRGVNFSAVSSDRWLGQVMRWPLRLIPRSVAVPIVQGPLRGKRWVVGSSTHGCWLGSYEYVKRRLFEQHVSSAGTQSMISELMWGFTRFSLQSLWDPLATWWRLSLVHVTWATSAGTWP